MVSQKKPTPEETELFKSKFHALADKLRDFNKIEKDSWQPIHDPFIETIRERYKELPDDFHMRANRWKEWYKDNLPQNNPTSFTGKIVEWAYDFLWNYCGNYTTLITLGNTFKEIKQVRLPTKRALMVWVGINERTLRAWEDGEYKLEEHDNTEGDLCYMLELLRGALNDIELAQEHMLRTGALDGTYVTNWANFQLSARYDYKAKVQQDTTAQITAGNFLDTIKNSGSDVKK